MAALYSPIQQLFVLYCCIARCIGWAVGASANGGRTALLAHMPYLMLSMLSWVSLMLLRHGESL